MKLLRRVGLGVLALLLASVLAFLYFKSQALDLKRQSQVVAALRTLKAIDARWNEDINAARADAPSRPARAAERADQLPRILAALAEETGPLGNPMLTRGVQDLGAAFLEKQTLFKKFEADNALLRGGERDALALIASLQQELRQLPPALAKKAAAAQLEPRLQTLNADLLRYYHQADDSARERVESAGHDISSIAAAYPDAVRETANSLDSALQVVLRHEPATRAAVKQMSLLPTAPRVDSVALAFDRGFQALAEEKELYRVYLVAYSGSLLVFLAWVGWQLALSYRKINEVNDALRAANEGLERRVQERTRELSEALAHLKESEALLVQSEKMSSLGQMVAGIAHEINTPLAYVKASLDSVDGKLPEISGLVDECQKLLDMLHGGDAGEEALAAQFTTVSALAEGLRQHGVLGELATLVHDGRYGIDQISEIVLNLKDFSRLDRSKVSRFNLNDGLESTLVIARNLVKPRKVIKNFAELPMIECSPSQINQVFLNLITNAAQATPAEGGEITLATGVDSRGQVRVDVIDNGHGIPPEVLPKIFDPFFTTKEVGSGTGLGLSIAYKIIQEHGGRIEVDSQVGHGTRFSIYLPTHSEHAAAAA